MAAKRKTPQAREYLRVSLDRSGRERSVDEQHADNEKAAVREGWSLGEPYRDIGSASRYARRGRDGYDALSADLAAGRFGADVLMLWESSRGSRRVSEWVALIEECEAHQVRIHVTTHGRTYDPANARDRRSLLEDSVDSEYETAKMSERIQRAAASNAEAGKWHGRIQYGYRRRRDPDTGRTIAQEPEPEEAKVVRELFERLNSGDRLNAIAADFDRRGVRTRTGKRFRPEYLRDVAMRPCYAGIRSHNGAEYPAQWPAIVDRSTFYAVRSRLSDATRKTPRPGRGHHLLSTIARCAVCGGKLTAKYNVAVTPRYGCHDKGCVTIAKADLDAYAETVVLAYLGDAKNRDVLAPPRADDTAVSAVRGELAELRSRLDEIGDAVADGEMSASVGGRAESKVRKRLSELETREREMVTPPVLATLLAPGKDVARRWKAAPLTVKREVATLLCSTDYLGELRVAHKPIRNQPCEPHERVVWWKGQQ